jgi:hypothetical protein
VVDTEGVLRTLVVALLIASGLYGLKESGALDRTGLLGTCETVTTARAEEGEWQACRGGRISGPPDLARDSCRKGATRDGITYWYCPEKLVSR